MAIGPRWYQHYILITGQLNYYLETWKSTESLVLRTCECIDLGTARQVLHLLHILTSLA